MSDRRKKVLFVSTPITDLAAAGAQQYLFDTRAIVNIPYGLLSIGSYVKKHATIPVDFKILDINDRLVTEYRLGNDIKNGQEYFENLVETETKEYQPDIVGVSLMFNTGYQRFDHLTRIIKQAAPKSLLIVGGNLATVLHNEIAVNEHVDAVNFGEGEISFLQLIESDDSLSYIRSSPAFVTKASLEAGNIPINLVVKDLDTIPPIDFSFVNLSNFNFPKQKGTVYKKHFDDEMISRIIYVSRGCPYSCNFCAGFNVHGKKVRFMSIERVVHDVKNMIVNDRLTDLYVCDDSFLLDKSRAKRLMREFINFGINVSFPALLMRNIDEEIAELLAKLGNEFQYTSMESGSDYVLKHIIQKPVTKDEARRAVYSLRKFGISVLTNIVVGSPEETDEHRQETLDTLYDIGFSLVFFMIALPIPGSRLYKQCKECGYLVTENFFSPSLTKCNIRTSTYSPEHIERQAYMMNLYTNFVHNYNLRMEKYDESIASFRNVLDAHPGHALAHYSLAKAHEGKGETEVAAYNMTKFLEIIESSPYWQDWALHFDLI